ncbi:D-alanyl-D-alanine carboxypeptidase [Lachnospiraceae bacterium MD308]|nr:D-alanyl-D-alanine carboxypeptidase [Lachnospiraceae bacterium MD308]
MRRDCKRLMSTALVFVLCMTLGMTAFAAETTQSGDKKTENAEKKELTEEEKRMQEELDKAYKIPTESNAWEGWVKGPGTYGEAAIVMEVSTGAILYAKSIDSKQYPASITKILTALVALENGELSDEVTFSHDSVAFLQPGDSSVGLKEGNVISLEQALYAMLLASANEAAYAVGENVGRKAGYDYNWFIEQMNARVQQLGGVNSHFVNTNGLHDAQHYTCARDMALVGRELFNDLKFFEIVQTLEYKIPQSKVVEEHVFQQKHKMLRPEDSNYYKYAIGGKTGFTSDALSTLVTMAEKDGVQLVCVVLRTHGKNVYPDTTKLLEYGFKNFSKIDVTQQVQSENVKEAVPGDNYVILPKGAAFTDLDVEITPEEDLKDRATLTYTYRGNYVGSANVKLSESYIKAYTEAAKEPEIKENSGNKRENKKEKKEEIKEKNGIFKIPGISYLWKKLGISEKSKRDKYVLAAASALLIVLVTAFIVLLVRYRRLTRQLEEDEKAEEEKKAEDRVRFEGYF